MNSERREKERKRIWSASARVMKGSALTIKVNSSASIRVDFCKRNELKLVLMRPEDGMNGLQWLICSSAGGFALTQSVKRFLALWFPFPFGDETFMAQFELSKHSLYSNRIPGFIVPPSCVQADNCRRTFNFRPSSANTGCSLVLQCETFLHCYIREAFPSHPCCCNREQ